MGEEGNFFKKVPLFPHTPITLPKLLIKRTTKSYFVLTKTLLYVKIYKHEKHGYGGITTERSSKWQALACYQGKAVVRRCKRFRIASLSCMTKN